MGMKNLFVFSSLNRNFALSLTSFEVEDRLHLGKTQINLVFLSICTIFALRRVRSLAAPQQLKNISLRSACTDFVIKSQRNRISLTYLDIIHHDMPPSDTTTTNLPERFRGVPL